MEIPTKEEALQRVSTRSARKTATIVSAAAASMFAEGLDHGKTWSKTWLSNALQAEPESLQFNLRVSELTELLEHDGYHLSSRGRSGEEWVVTPLNQSGAVVDCMQRKAMNWLRRSAVFCHSTLKKHGAKMDDSTKYKLKKKEEIQALRYALMARVR